MIYYLNIILLTKLQINILNIEYISYKILQIVMYGSVIGDFPLYYKINYFKNMYVIYRKL